MRELRLYWALYCFTCRRPIAVERATWAQDGDGVQVANPAKLPEHFSVKCSDCSDNNDYKSDSIYQELLPVMLSRDTKLVPVMAVPDESGSHADICHSTKHWNIPVGKSVATTAEAAPMDNRERRNPL
jgi:hypothetical protein